MIYAKPLIMESLFPEVLTILQDWQNERYWT